MQKAYHLGNNGNIRTKGVQIKIVGWNSIINHLSFSVDGTKKRKCEGGLSRTSASDCQLRISTIVIEELDIRTYANSFSCFDREADVLQNLRTILEKT